jgi:hypothetical protein
MERRPPAQREEVASLRDELRSRGFALARGVFTTEGLLNAQTTTQTLIDDWFAGRGRQDPDLWSCPAGEPPVETLYRIHRFETKTDVPRTLVSSPRFERLLLDVFGSEAVPTECAVTLKVPGRGVEVPWHRDPVDAPRFSVYNFTIYLDDSGPDNGCLHAVPGSHLENGETSERMPEAAVPIPAAAGDVLVHDVHLEHGSPSSDAPRGRRAIVIEFSDPRTRPALRDGSLEPLW